VTFKSDGDDSRLVDKQAGGFILGNQASKGRASLLAYSPVYYLYIVNLVVAVVSDRPLVILELISGGEGNANSENKPF
jgi:hypothetical protein